MPSIPASNLAPCYSMLLVRPFVTLLLRSPRADTAFVRKIAALPDDTRFPVQSVLRWLDSGVQLTGDSDLGLHAVGAWSHGSGDVIEFAAATAATVGDALKAVLRYVRILNEAADFVLLEQGDVGRLELRSRIPLNRQAADFQMGTLMLGMRNWLGTLEGFEISFAHAAPQTLQAYADTFSPARVRFGTPHDTVVFSMKVLEAAIPSANPALHRVLLRHAAQLASEVPERDALARKVRKLLLDALPSGTSDADSVARTLGMSRRTLSRYLEREATSYKELLEKTRHEMALTYLSTSTLDSQQIAFLLGYSMTAAFSRAFARWEGQSPTEYRRAHATRR